MTRPDERKRAFTDRVVRQGLSRHITSDLYHLLLTASWPKLFALLAGVYATANALFALLYMLDPGGLENARAGSFLDHFFFSVQTMATIGYGKMAPRSTYANALVAVEALGGLLGMAMATGLMFAKFSRPTARVMFSKALLVTTRDGVPSLVLRLANQRTNQIVEASLRLILLRDEVTKEGDRLRRLHELKLVRSNSPAFAISWTAIHLITPDSPLYGITEEAFRSSSTEILASLVGTDETFSQTVHARYTWFADEVRWGGRFADVLERKPDGQIFIDYARFDKIEENVTPGK
jgi:inward rectifier potassium channel